MDPRIINMEATIMHKDSPIINFRVEKNKLVYLEEYAENRDKYPLEFKPGLISKQSIDQFIKYRLVQDGAQFIQEYLKDLGLRSYDVDKIIWLTNGVCTDDVYWFRFKDKDVQKWEDVPGRRLY